MVMSRLLTILRGLQGWMRRNAIRLHRGCVGYLTTMFWLSLVSDCLFLQPAAAVENPYDIDIDKPRRSAYDYIIVGGGTAGSVVAARLSEHPYSHVLLLEAGGAGTHYTEGPLFSPRVHGDEKYDWKFKARKDPGFCIGMTGKRCSLPRPKMLGGLSAFNRMAYIRGNRHDFDQWEALGNPGWGYDDLLPYFIRAEDNQDPYLRHSPYHGVKGPMRVSQPPYHSDLAPLWLKAAVSAGFIIGDFNGRHQSRFTLHQTRSWMGERWSTARGYLTPASHRYNLHVQLHCYVTRVLIDPHTKRARGVVYVKHKKRYVVWAKKEVIISAGTFKSPQLLKLSGVGPCSELLSHGIHCIQDLPGVGENLQSHYGLGGIDFLVNQKQKHGLTLKQISSAKSIKDMKKYRRGPLMSHSAMEGIGFVSSPFNNATCYVREAECDAADWPDIMLLFFPIQTAVDGGKQYRKVFNLSKKLYKARFAKFAYKAGFRIVPVNVRPHSRGRVKLRTGNPFDHPDIYLNLFHSLHDVHVLKEGGRMAEQLGLSSHFLRIGSHLNSSPNPFCFKHPAGGPIWWECRARVYPETTFSESSTCAMGPPEDHYAVVDNQLRVYGITGLRVVDASVMPRIPSGDTVASTVMVAERASDIIRAFWYAASHPDYSHNPSEYVAKYVLSPHKEEVTNPRHEAGENDASEGANGQDPPDYGGGGDYGAVAEPDVDPDDLYYDDGPGQAAGLENVLNARPNKDDIGNDAEAGEAFSHIDDDSEYADEAVGAGVSLGDGDEDSDYVTYLLEELLLNTLQDGRDTLLTNQPDDQGGYADELEEPEEYGPGKSGAGDEDGWNDDEDYSDYYYDDFYDDKLDKLAAEDGKEHGVDLDEEKYGNEDGLEGNTGFNDLNAALLSMLDVIGGYQNESADYDYLDYQDQTDFPNYDDIEDDLDVDALVNLLENLNFDPSSGHLNNSAMKTPRPRLQENTTIPSDTLWRYQVEKLNISSDILKNKPSKSRGVRQTTAKPNTYRSSHVSLRGKYFGEAKISKSAADQPYIRETFQRRQTKRTGGSKPRKTSEDSARPEPLPATVWHKKSVATTTQRSHKLVKRKEAKGLTKSPLDRRKIFRRQNRKPLVDQQLQQGSRQRQRSKGKSPAPNVLRRTRVYNFKEGRNFTVQSPVPVYTELRQEFWPKKGGSTSPTAKALVSKVSDLEDIHHSEETTEGAKEELFKKRKTAATPLDRNFSSHQVKDKLKTTDHHQKSVTESDWQRRPIVAKTVKHVDMADSARPNVPAHRKKPLKENGGQESKNENVLHGFKAIWGEKRSVDVTTEKQPTQARSRLYPDKKLDGSRSALSRAEKNKQNSEHNSSLELEFQAWQDVPKLVESRRHLEANRSDRKIFVPPDHAIEPMSFKNAAVKPKNSDVEFQTATFGEKKSAT